jgi:hypothetical protein
MWLEVGPALLEHGLVDHQVDGVGPHVDDDAVTLLDQGNGATIDRLGRNVADAETVCPPPRSVRR